METSKEEAIEAISKLPESIWRQAQPCLKVWKWGTRIHMEVFVPVGFGLCWIWIIFG